MSALRHCRPPHPLPAPAAAEEMPANAGFALRLAEPFAGGPASDPVAGEIIAVSLAAMRLAPASPALVSQIRRELAAIAFPA